MRSWVACAIYHKPATLTDRCLNHKKASQFHAKCLIVQIFFSTIRKQVVTATGDVCRISGEVAQPKTGSSETLFSCGFLFLSLNVIHGVCVFVYLFFVALGIYIFDFCFNYLVFNSCFLVHFHIPDYFWTMQLKDFCFSYVFFLLFEDLIFILYVCILFLNL